jgi:hypothetical protein
MSRDLIGQFTITVQASSPPKNITVSREMAEQLHKVTINTNDPLKPCVNHTWQYIPLFIYSVVKSHFK